MTSQSFSISRKNIFTEHFHITHKRINTLLICGQELDSVFCLSSEAPKLVKEHQLLDSQPSAYSTLLDSQPSAS